MTSWKAEFPVIAVVLLCACAGERRAADTPPEDTAARVSQPSAATLASADTWRIAVAGGDGAVGPGTSHADLARRFAGAVTDTMIHMGEAQFAPGTVAHAEDPLRRIEVVWQDSARLKPWRVQVAGDSSRWVVGPGITLGTRLTELERLNGRPLSLTGFGWDYGGTVMGWDQGALEQALIGGNGRVIVRLAVDSAAAGSDEARSVSGDGVFRSDDPAMRRLDPAVHQIIVEYDGPPDGA
jgi:hypothetical protein